MDIVSTGKPGQCSEWVALLLGPPLDHPATQAAAETAGTPHDRRA